MARPRKNGNNTIIKEEISTMADNNIQVKEAPKSKFIDVNDKVKIEILSNGTSKAIKK